MKQAGSSGKTFVEVVDPDVQPISQLWRYEVDAETGSTNAHMLASRAMEFPAINPDYIGIATTSFDLLTLFIKSQGGITHSPVFAYRH